MQGEFIFEGKKYISASRASKICGYTSDYIGQLCRKGSLDCRMVGRAWFVEEESLKNHKVVASSTPRGRIPMYQKNLVQNQVQNLAPQNLKKTAEKPGFAFHSVQQNWADCINEVEDKKQVRQFSFKIASGVALVVLLVTASSLFLSNKSEFISNPLSVLKNENIAVVGNGIQTTASVFKSSQSEAHDSLSYSANVFQSFGISFGQKASDLVDGAYRGLAMLSDVLFDASRKVRVLVMNSNSSDSYTTGEKTGLVVVPSANDSSANEKVKQYVTDSFSDETTIIPDPSGNSGLIKPIFKKNKDQEYLYVMVPFKGSKN